ncbi:MAG: bifunctional glutamate N-acetyltransferase/amino-acid acetyltransferase ArgJ [Dehalococcoidia bacterium]
MPLNSETIAQGTVTSPKGFLAGATYVGLKNSGGEALDLGILYSKVPCAAAGVFTTSKIKAAPVLLCQRHLINNRAQSIVVNSGCANACTGEQGMLDAEEMAAITATKLGLPSEDVLVASTGIIGTALPMELVRNGIERVTPSTESGHRLARAIITTDTFPKEIAVRVRLEHEENELTIGGIAKGSGMIHPDLATLLCFLTTDAAVDPGFLQKSLKQAVDASFNMVTIDGDTSPNDSVIIMANGLAGNEVMDGGGPGAREFQEALEGVCLFLAKWIARDGEGATRLIEVTVDGAVTVAQARSGARTVASSPLVKAAVHGSDPNWGRIVAALGRSGVEMLESRIDLYVRGVCLVKNGVALPFDREHVKSLLDDSEVPIRVCLNLGEASATAWGCDLSEEYVTINSEYTT